MEGAQRREDEGHFSGGDYLEGFKIEVKFTRSYRTKGISLGHEIAWNGQATEDC